MLDRQAEGYEFYLDQCPLSCPYDNRRHSRRCIWILRPRSPPLPKSGHNKAFVISLPARNDRLVLDEDAPIVHVRSFVISQMNWGPDDACVSSTILWLAMTHNLVLCFRPPRTSDNSVSPQTEVPKKLAQTFAEPPKMPRNLSKNDFPLVP